MLFGSKNKKKPALTTLADVGTMGMHMVASTFIGLGMGWYLDKWLGTRPWFLLIFLLLGIVSGFRNMFQEARRLQGRPDDQGDGDAQDSDKH
ncbi:AtpZ/AtpI family protein [Desulfocurvus vexinensis]|uniref:AtpZ/AtpI family protein n=1 Tax=Desulfocurvus vexinensis TaxID=399548 RepID=UPI00048B5A71|nr:AtpZ/AtpI family protein [Desulfocurvus vexinensis]